MRMLFLTLFILTAFPGYCQDIFTEEEFLTTVKKYHPLLKAARLEVTAAKADVLAARGAFDPVAEGKNSRKNFEGVPYYDRRQVTLNIPTWVGIDVYAGNEGAEGSKLNPEETKGHFSYVGIEIPDIQNIAFDKRRATLQKAKLLFRQSEQERKAVVNDLLQEALTSYWHWWEQYQLIQVTDSLLGNAHQRFKMVRTAYQLGDRAAIDTIEALTQVQWLQQQRTERYTGFQKALLELNTWLWNEQEKPWSLPQTKLPQPEIPKTGQGSDWLAGLSNHPELKVYDIKIEGQQIEKRLSIQSLLPVIGMKYQVLNRSFQPGKLWQTPFFQNDYRYYLSVSVPLRLSAGRGAFQKAKAKLYQTSLQQSYKKVQLQNKLLQYYTGWEQTDKQVQQQTSLLANYLQLQRAEETKFRNGESSLFLINAREQKTLEVLQKLVALRVKNMHEWISLQWAAGRLAD